jgi:hypothetical protein
VMVPCMTVPFLSSIVTVSLASFMRNLTSFMVAVWVDSSDLQRYQHVTTLISRRDNMTSLVRAFRMGAPLPTLEAHQATIEFRQLFCILVLLFEPPREIMEAG